MRPLLLVAACTLLAAQASALFHYRIEGHLSSIESSHVQNVLRNRAAYSPQENHIRNRLNILLSGRLEEFFVDEFQIHADSTRDSAIFVAHFSTAVSKDEILKAARESHDFTLLNVREADFLPSAPSYLTGNDNAVNSCKNGGILLPNATCVCPSFYVGDQCENVQCLHHGVQDGNRCACPPGVYAIDCESRGCAPGVQDNIDVSKQTFILVLNQKTSMGYILNTLIGQIGSLLDKINTADPNLIQNYILVSYLDSKLVYYMQKSFSANRADFMNNLAAINIVDGNALQPTNRAIATAQSFAPLMRGFSNIFVFTDSADSEGSAVNHTFSAETTEMMVIEKTKAWRSRIVYLLAQTGTNKIDTTGDSYDVYRRIARATLGDVVVMDTSDISNIVNSFLSYYRQNEVVAVRYGATGSQTIELVGDDEQQAAYVLVTVDPDGTKPSVTIDDGEWAPEVAGKLFSLYWAYPASSVSVTVQGTTPWNVRVWVESGNTALVSYTTDSMVDVGSFSCMAELRPFATAVSIGLANPKSLEWLDLSNGSSLDSAITGTQRTSECTFPVIFPNRSMSCTPGPFAQRLAFVTNNVVTHRIVPGYCGQLDHHDVIPFTCFNGGTRLGTYECRCTSQWIGLQCDVPFCSNEGSPNPFPGNGQPLCKCPPGYTGQFCEILQCRIAQPDYNESYNRSMAVVIQSSMSQAQVNSKIYNGVQTLLGLMKGSDAFNDYVLTTFNEVNMNGQIHTAITTDKFPDAASFLTALQSNNIKYLATQAQQQDSLGALMVTIQSMNYEKSAIFHFVDTAAKMDTVESNEVVRAAIEKRLEINIVITPQFQMQDLCMDADSMATFTMITEKTGGVLLNLCIPHAVYKTDPIVQLFTVYGSTHHHTEILTEDVLLKCSGDLPFFVNDPMQEIYFVVNGYVTELFMVSLTDISTGAMPLVLQPINDMPFLGMYYLTDVLTSSGTYSITVAPNSFVQAGKCNIKVMEKSNVTVTLGFAANPANDIESRSLIFATPIYPVVHLSKQFDTAPYVTLLARTTDKSEIYSETGVPRSNCSYETFFTKEFVCTELNDYFVMKVQYNTNDLQVIQRSQRGYCYMTPHQCLNGGDYFNGSCHCMTGYSGNLCETPACQNGVVVYQYQCRCGLYFSGSRCQYTKCEAWNFLETHDPRLQQFKQITFVLNINKDQLLPNIFLNNAMQQFIEESERSDIPKQYTLITFDQNKITNVISTAHSDQFVNIFNSTITKYTPTVATQTMAAGALVEAYKINVQPPDVIFLFTGTDTLSSSAVFSTIIKQQLGTQVNVIYTPQNVVYPQQPAGKNGYLLTFAARQSGGRVLPITQYAVNGFDKVLASTLQENVLIHDDAMKDCSTGVTFSFDMEVEVHDIVLDITGNGVSTNNSVTVVDGTGATVDLSQSILFTDSAAVIYSIKHIAQRENGTWTVSVTTTSGSCFLQVRATADMQIIPGFTSDAENDFVKSTPFSGFGTSRNNQMVFRVTSSAANILTKLIITETDYQQPWNTRKALMVVDIIQRDPSECAYQFITNRFLMPTNTYQKFVVHGIDPFGTAFQRTWFFTMPNTKDNATTCVNGVREYTGECSCDSKHTGDYCTDRICQNGGSPSYGICVCNNGYYGDYCEKFLLNL